MLSPNGVVSIGSFLFEIFYVQQEFKIKKNRTRQLAMYRLYISIKMTKKVKKFNLQAFIEVLYEVKTGLINS